MFVKIFTFLLLLVAVSCDLRSHRALRHVDSVGSSNVAPLSGPYPSMAQLDASPGNANAVGVNTPSIAGGTSPLAPVMLG
ncbi:unnamed protein product [Cylicocyclus nassatus]|uniref:Uncharacterized protein n=1 Tax=Cylicocyclus nassatus TaxID=53992 RepID=A0AA36MAP4_CYLNA|nr:unnamed protein product [Cylicocyclus nassatus]